MENYNVILGSGGVKGFCHIGFLKAIDEIGIKINKIAGLSVGSIVASMYVNGWDYKDITDWFIDKDFIKALKRPTYKILYDCAKHKKIMPMFDSSKLCHQLVNELLITPKDKLYIVTTNFTDKKMEFYNKTLMESRSIEFKDLLNSSMAIPGLFVPVKINGDTYVDGGTMVGNCPVDLFSDSLITYTNIAVHISQSKKNGQKIGLFNNLLTAYELTQQELFERQVVKSKDEILIIPSCDDLLSVDFNLSKEERYRLIKLGYDQTIDVFKKLGR